MCIYQKEMQSTEKGKRKRQHRSSAVHFALLSMRYTLTSRPIIAQAAAHPSENVNGRFMHVVFCAHVPFSYACAPSWTRARAVTRLRLSYRPPTCVCERAAGWVGPVDRCAAAVAVGVYMRPPGVGVGRWACKLYRIYMHMSFDQVYTRAHMCIYTHTHMHARAHACRGSRELSSLARC